MENEIFLQQQDANKTGSPSSIIVKNREKPGTSWRQIEWLLTRNQREVKRTL
jgi:hypothetical protein